jgi:hypothetical protein
MPDVKTKSFGANIAMDINCYQLISGQMHGVNTEHTIAGAASSVMLIIPATNTVALTGELGADSSARMIMWENVTYTAASGTTLTSYCKNRTLTTTSTTQFIKAPTWTTAPGYALYRNGIPAFSGPVVKAPGSFEDKNYWILNKSYKYALEVQDLSAASNTVHWNLQICEH